MAFLLMGLGVGWSVLVGVVLIIALKGVENSVAIGQVSEPRNVQFVVAWASAVVFALPGIGIAIAGWRKRSGT